MVNVRNSGFQWGRDAEKETQLGHASAAFTMQVYTHVDGSLQAFPVGKTPGLLGKMFTSAADRQQTCEFVRNKLYDR